MLFNSFEFLYFLIFVFSLYYLPIFRQIQLQLLVGASLCFYAWNNPSLLVLLAVSIVFNSWISYRLAFSSRKMLGLGCGLVFNLGLIIFFKYADLFVRTLGLAGTSWGAKVSAIPLPIGISFYTFEAISLLMDISRRQELSKAAFVDASPGKHLSKTSLFIAFFPHLISGPILKAHDFYPQIGPKRFSNIDWAYCLRLLVLGYFLKCVVADNLRDITTEIVYPKFLLLNSITLLVLVFGYSMQIFADFAGYSLIAIGLGAMFGYQLPTNFNFPYVADSLSDFWRRWHISLSSWLKEYLYIPLGGSRLGRARTYINLFVVMFLGSLWHGAAWSFALWGTYHGLGLAAERYISEKWPRLGASVARPIKMLLVFSYVTLGWLLFKLTDYKEAADYLRAILENWSVGIGGQRTYILTVLLLSFPIVVYHGAYLLKERITLGYLWEGLIYGAMLAACILSPGLGSAFIYFQF